MTIDEQELEHLLSLSWTILRETTPEGDVVLRVQEIPSAVGSGADDAAREADLWDSLTESLRAYLHFGGTVPVTQSRVILHAVAGQTAQRVSWARTESNRTSGI